MSSHEDRPAITHRLRQGYKAFTKSALIEMLEEASAGQRYSELPLHMRRMADEDDDEDDEMTKAADKDREDRADLADSTRPGNAPDTKPEDYPRAVSKKYAGKKKARGKA